MTTERRSECVLVAMGYVIAHKPQGPAKAAGTLSYE
jgi:hypothetical protein